MRMPQLRRLSLCTRLTAQTVSASGEVQPTDVRGEPEWIDLVVGNLVANASRHATSRVVVTVDSTDGTGRVVIADDGPGFPPELLPLAFDRFARSDSQRAAGSGAGLGLVIVVSITHAVGGSVTARNGPPLGGARVSVELPLS